MLRADGLCIARGRGATRVIAVSHLDLSVAPGETLGLMGPSGSGKTSVLLALAGDIQVLSGTVHAGSGSPMTVAQVYQDFRLADFLSAEENVALALELRGREPKQALLDAREELASLGIGPELASHRPHALSGGQQQRVAIARATAVRPTLLLADEPTAALDEENSVRVMTAMVQRVRTLGAYLVVATHDPVVADLCDDVVHLRDERRTGNTES